jgi:hypothetical protein
VQLKRHKEVARLAATSAEQHAEEVSEESCCLHSSRPAECSFRMACKQVLTASPSNSS